MSSNPEIPQVFYSHGSVIPLQGNGKWKSVCTDTYFHANQLCFHGTYKNKITEDIIKTCLKNVYSTFEGSKYILSDTGGEFTSKQFTWLAKELGFIKCTPPLIPQQEIQQLKEHTLSQKHQWEKSSVIIILMGMTYLPWQQCHTICFHILSQEKLHSV